MNKLLSKLFPEGLPFKKEESESVLGVDIGSSSIKIVQVKKKEGKAILETYGSLALGPYAKTEIGQVTNLSSTELFQALSDIINESNVTTKVSAIAIPSSASLVSIISIPSAVDKENLDKIIPIEAKKYIPVPISEVTLDWWVMPERVESFEENENNENNVTREVKKEVLLVAIHNDILVKYRELLNKTKLDSKFFEIEVFSSIRSTFSHELAPVLLVDFGASKTKLSIAEYGVVKVFHVISRGSADITKNISQSMSVSFEEAEKLKREVGLDREVNKDVAMAVESSFNYIFSEINKIVLNYEKKYNKSINKVIFSGGGALTKGLADRAGKNFKVKVFFGDPFSKTESPAFLESVLKKSGPEFAVAVGLAFRQLK
ncbi:MAG: type IV pilus assembly protein PilM [Patescibacteria group bacterium]|nr:type IV pilus assembly protein PilM [Patescibacteria group bacterium]